MRLLKESSIVKWIIGDLNYFLYNMQSVQTKNFNYNLIENNWGKSMLKYYYPDEHLKFKNNQWSGIFGEKICQEIYTLLNSKIPTKPIQRGHYLPDLETDDSIIEVKTAMYSTTGTACEKILGSPFKYADVPQLYGKPLKIVCVGGAERICRQKYVNLDKCSNQKQKFLDFFKQNHIEFIGASDLLRIVLINK